MQTLSEIRALLAERGLRPKHRLGQNFLHDHNQLRRLIDAAAISDGDVVLEIGPGTGALTEALLAAGATVVACELDEGMATIVEERFASYAAATPARFTLVRGDALESQRRLNPQVLQYLLTPTNGGFKLVANLPYQIASPLMTTLLIDHPECTGQFVTIQKEVADRLMARPSSKAYGPLGVIVQALADVKRIATLSPGCFWPEPEVTSAMVALSPTTEARLAFAGRERSFARFVTELFSKRRKQLGTIIGRSHPAWPDLQRSGIAADVRPEALSVAQVIKLHQSMQAD